MTLRYIGVKVPRPLLWIGATAGSALGNAVGFGALTGRSVRYRVYGVTGIDANQAVRPSMLEGATFALGLFVLSGLGLACAAPAVSALLDIPAPALLVSGQAMLIGVAILTTWCHPDRAPIRLGQVYAARRTLQ
jgi:phosphatidylglycerol lysyltransferase